MCNARTKKRSCAFGQPCSTKNTPWPSRWLSEKPSNRTGYMKTKRWQCTRRNIRAVADLPGLTQKSDEGYAFSFFSHACKISANLTQKAAPPGRCHSCNRAETPEWRRGPDGARTLCNACGLHYAKLTRKVGANKASGLGSNLKPKTPLGSASPSSH